MTATRPISLELGSASKFGDFEKTHQECLEAEIIHEFYSIYELVRILQNTPLDNVTESASENYLDVIFSFISIDCCRDDPPTMEPEEENPPASLSLAKGIMEPRGNFHNLV